MSDLLEIAARVLEGVSPPDGAFDPQGAWRHVYGVYDLAANLATNTKVVRNVVGSLTLVRTPVPGGGSILALDFERRTPPGASEKISGRLQCAAGLLAPPTAWQFTWEGRGSGRSGSLRKTNQRDFPPSAYTSNWALFDAVQRLPRQPGEPIRFTLFDEFDLWKPNQQLAFRKTTEVALANGRTKLHAFEQFGDGVLPVIYWTDDRGRLLLVISGLIAYAMEGDRG